MKRKRFTEEQIAFALRQHESGTAVLKSFAASFARSAHRKGPTVHCAMRG